MGAGWLYKCMVDDVVSEGQVAGGGFGRGSRVTRVHGQVGQRETSE